MLFVFSLLGGGAVIFMDDLSLSADAQYAFQNKMSQMGQMTKKSMVKNYIQGLSPGEKRALVRKYKLDQLSPERKRALLQEYQGAQ